MFQLPLEARGGIAEAARDDEGSRSVKAGRVIAIVRCSILGLIGLGFVAVGILDSWVGRPFGLVPVKTRTSHTPGRFSRSVAMREHATPDLAQISRDDP